MPRKRLSPNSETVRLEVKIPAALKASVEERLRPKEDLSKVVRGLLEKFVRSRCTTDRQP